jgi:hypothetical protein
VGEPTAREMLLEAAPAHRRRDAARGFLHRVVPDADVAADALAAQPHRRAGAAGGAPEQADPSSIKNASQRLRSKRQQLLKIVGADPYAYADSAEHREGITAFLPKDAPVFLTATLPATMSNHNLFAALRAAFPADLDARRRDRRPGAPLYYTWRDLDRASAMHRQPAGLAALPDARVRRVAVQVEKSVEAMMLYLATLRAGYVFLPLNTAYQSAEIEYFIGNAEPAWWCAAAGTSAGSARSPSPGTRHVFTLNDDRSGSLLERAAHCSDRTRPVASQRRRPGRHPLHQRHHRAQQGRHAVARQPAVQRACAQGLLGLESRSRAATC